MKLTLGILVICTFIKMHRGQVENSVPFLETINNVADRTTNFFENAVDIPRNIYQNAARRTTDYVHSASSKILESKLISLLDTFRICMREGMPDVGIPIMDPLFISHYDLDTHNEEIGDVSGFIHNVTVRGASTFIVDYASLSLIGPMVTLNLTVPQLYVVGYYNIKGRIGNMFDIYGNGPFTATIYNTKIYLHTVLGYSRGLYMKSFDLDFSIESINMDLRNFMRNKKYGKVMNEVLEEMAPKALEIIKPEILPQIQNYILNRANDTLYHLTVRDVINFLTLKIDIGDFRRIVADKIKIH
ncbi:uncharacterized protein LOC107270648 isoform X2 [Cephus cinctus]|uniref:Uncharacterized protein LOC107270648 isoform X2 n=1 Tax=Cephus cinctus TaxID=211228 RepID=A0AAJ7C408_CEPCN|nr:uncharacterized protein LOC107270648 isoform X2 [Cephus cinctus]XP_015601327.1 uncharacterized protein LOC107270648 isoform X2 [Cephus cinctus]